MTTAAAIAAWKATPEYRRWKELDAEIGKAMTALHRLETKNSVKYAAAIARHREVIETLRAEWTELDCLRHARYVELTSR